jgi:hypothetical protein
MKTTITLSLEPRDIRAAKQNARRRRSASLSHYIRTLIEDDRLTADLQATAAPAQPKGTGHAE